MKIKEPYEAIYIGNGWTFEFWIAAENSKRDIRSSSGNVITTVGQHGYSNNAYVMVALHETIDNIYSSLNGVYQISDVTDCTFTLTDATGNGAGVKTGNVAVMSDITDDEFTAELRDRTGEGAGLIDTPDIDKLDAQGKVTLSFTDEETLSDEFKALQTKKAFCEVKKNGATIIRLELSIEPRIIQ